MLKNSILAPTDAIRIGINSDPADLLCFVLASNADPEYRLPCVVPSDLQHDDRQQRDHYETFNNGYMNMCIGKYEPVEPHTSLHVQS